MPLALNDMLTKIITDTAIEPVEISDEHESPSDAAAYLRVNADHIDCRALITTKVGLTIEVSHMANDDDICAFFVIFAESCATSPEEHDPSLDIVETHAVYAYDDSEKAFRHAARALEAYRAESYAD